MAGINLSELKIPTNTDHQKKKKMIVRLDELSDAYSNPEIIIKGKLTKPNPLEALDKKLEKIEARTEYLIEKHHAKEAKAALKEQLTHSETTVKPSLNHSQKLPIAKDPTYIDFVLMKGLKKIILNSIKENIFEENGEHFSFIDTDLIKEKADSDTNVIRDTIHKLKKDNWFELIRSHYTKRLIKIKKEIYHNC